MLLGTISFLKHAPHGSAAAELLLEEADLLAQLEHPHLVSLLDVFVGVSGLAASPVTGLAMRWVDGTPLDDGLSGCTMEECLAAFCELLEVVDYLHRRGVLHLDIKPDNVLKTDLGVILLDLGSARPLTSGPGEAGGTLGYAAPEILSGQAATTAADIFGLGALLYKLITGVSPYGDIEPGELRGAILAGDIVPMRAVLPSVSRELARLIESMLSVEVSKRPASIAAIAESLSYTLKKQGAPPALGSDSVRTRLRSHLSAPPRLVYVVGQPGSGRQTLIKHSLHVHSRTTGEMVLDLTEADEPTRAILRLAALSRPDLPLPLPGPGWLSGVSAGLREPVGFAGAIYMGREEDHPAERLQRLEQLSDALLERGCSVFWAVREPPEDTEAVRLQPLSEDDTILLGRFFGLTSRQHLFETCRGTGGWPGALIEALQPSRRPLSFMERKADELLRILCLLPKGIPDPFVFAILTDDDLLPALLAQRSVQWGEDGRLYLLGDYGEVTLDELTRQRVRALLEAHRGRWDDPLWTGLAAARLGSLTLARHCFAHATEEARHRPAELEEFCTRMITAGHRPARLVLAELKEGAGDLTTAATLLTDIPDRTPTENLRLVRVLRRARRLDEAERIARRELGSPLSAHIWLELAFINCYRENIVAAEHACSQAARLDPILGENDVLGMRLKLASMRLDRGEKVDGILPILEDIERRAVQEDVSNQILIIGSRLLKTGFGKLNRSQRLLALAVHKADRDNDQRSSAGLRINLSNLLKAMGRRTEARIILKEALQIAGALGAAGLLMQIHYSLAGLELEAGRLPAARQYIDRFERDAQSNTTPAVQLRVSMLRAQLSFYSQEHQEAYDLFSEIVESPACPDSNKASVHVYMSHCLLALGRAPEVLSLLDGEHVSRGTVNDATVSALKGRAYLSIGRGLLAGATEMLPENPDPGERLDVGEIYLAAAGEDLDPRSFSARRAQLDTAARLLRGSRAAQAATLRDRITTAPGADLDGIVALTEAMGNPQTFPAALARLITDALGANRVLIMIRIPGLGKQIKAEMLSGGETAGISSEVLRRIQKPDDYWLAADAFGDPAIRNTSQTVRTFELKSLLAVAIPHGGEAVGALYVDDLYRAGRFDMEDVETLKRLARAVGDMLPLLSRQGSTPLVNPRDVLGVLLCHTERIKNLEYSLAMLKGQRLTNLLITGETGTGKSVLARRIAKEVLGLSGVEVVVLRKGDPNMLVTQLVGTRRGDFTGALNQEGAIQRAIRSRSAIFLDEVQNLDEVGQQILLPLLEQPRHFGGLTATSRPIDSPLHIILGTNVDTSQRRWAAHFREDLWYRMSAIHIDLPPLRDRGAESVYQYLRSMLAKQGAPPPERVFDTATLQVVTNWRWPGNLRQLHTFARRAAHHYMTTTSPIPFRELNRLGLSEDDEPNEVVPTPLASDHVERFKAAQMMAALRRNRWVQKAAAVELGLSPSSFNKWLSRYDLLEEVRTQRKRARAAAAKPAQGCGWSSRGGQ